MERSLKTPFHFFIMNKHKSIFFILLFFIFSISLYGKESHFSLESRIGTIYVDDSGLAGLYNNSIFTFSNNFNLFYLKTGFYLGGIPGDISIRNQKEPVELNDVLYFGGFIDLAFNLPSDFSIDINMLAGLMNSDPGYLVVIPGSVSAPVYGGVQACLNMPLNFYFTTAIYGTDLSVNNENDEALGDGSVYCYYVNGGKSWNLQKKYNHFISADAGFLYAGGSARITAYDELDKTILFPYSFMYGSAAGSLCFITFGANYSLKGKNLVFSTDLYGLINVWSEIQYYYKATYKNNLIYDGSVVKENKTFSFSNADFLLFFNAQLSYNLHTADFNSEFFIRKDFIIPYISKNTQNCLTQNEKSSESTSSGSVDVKSLLKTILLSGLSVGVKLEI